MLFHSNARFIQNRAPHIKFSIYHKDLPAFETEMFFPNQHLADKDSVLKKINAKDRKLFASETYWI